jgi:hypothetical protein
MGGRHRHIGRDPATSGVARSGTKCNRSGRRPVGRQREGSGDTGLGCRDPDAPDLGGRRPRGRPAAGPVEAAAEVPSQTPSQSPSMGRVRGHRLRLPRTRHTRPWRRTAAEDSGRGACRGGGGGALSVALSQSPSRFVFSSVLLHMQNDAPESLSRNCCE